MIANARVECLQGLKQRPCEDRFRLLDANVPAVRESVRGFLYGVMDGVGSAPKALRAAQHVADRLSDFYLRQDEVCATAEGVYSLLFDVNLEIRDWGLVPGSDLSLGAAAATIAWLDPSERLILFQAGDTVAYRYDGRLTRLTREHADSKGVTSYFGMGHTCRIDIESPPFEEGDLLCLVTDGVTKSMPDARIEEVFREVHPSRVARELALRARNLGSADDITAIVVELDEW